MRNEERIIAPAYNCPCCGQLVKEYKRKVSSPAIKGLIQLYHMTKTDPDDFIHVFDLGDGARGGDFAKLRYWDLVEELANDDEDKKNSGYWAITDFGQRFVRRRAKIRKYCHIYNGEVLSFSGPKITIVTALNEQFSYKELMS